MKKRTRSVREGSNRIGKHFQVVPFFELGLENDNSSDAEDFRRYALRTSPQWIGPQLEDLSLAQDQITIESNSTTDNPLVDVEGSTIHHGKHSCGFNAP